MHDLETLLGVTRGHQNYDFLLAFHSIHWPISHHFRDKQWFQSR